MIKNRNGVLGVAFILVSCLYGHLWAQAPRPTVLGQNLWDPITQKPMDLRGFNWGWWGTALEQDGIACDSLGAKIIRMPFRWFFTGDGSDMRDTTAPGNLDLEKLALLDQYLIWCEQAGLSVILFAGSDQGAGDSSRNYWSDEVIKQQFIVAWKFLAQRYLEQKAIAAYEILSEPHPKKPTTHAQLRDFYREVMDSIRTVDKHTPFVVGPNDHYDIYLLDSILLPERDDIIYTFNFYLPTAYAKIEKRELADLAPFAYPGIFVEDEDTTMLDEHWLDSVARIGASFSQRNNVPVFVNQVGVRSRCPGSLQYTRDALHALTRHGVGWTWWTYRTNKKDPGDHGLFWLDSTDHKTYHRKDTLAEVLHEALTYSRAVHLDQGAIHPPKTKASALRKRKPSSMMSPWRLPGIIAPNGRVKVRNTHSHSPGVQ